MLLARNIFFFVDSHFQLVTRTRASKMLGPPPGWSYPGEKGPAGVRAAIFRLREQSVKRWVGSVPRRWWFPVETETAFDLSR